MAGPQNISNHPGKIGLKNQMIGVKNQKIFLVSAKEAKIYTELQHYISLRGINKKSKQLKKSYKIRM